MMEPDNPIIAALGFVGTVDAHIGSIEKAFDDDTDQEQYIISLHVETLHLKLERRRTFGRRAR